MMIFTFSQPWMLLYFLDSDALLAISAKHLLEKVLKLQGIWRTNLNAKLTNNNSWLRYLWSSSSVFTLNGCFLFNTSRRVIPKDQISNAFPKVHFSWSVPIISYGAAYPFVPINLLVTFTVPASFCKISDMLKSIIFNSPF